MTMWLDVMVQVVIPCHFCLHSCFFFFKPATVWDSCVRTDSCQERGTSCHQQPQEVDAAAACGKKPGASIVFVKTILSPKASVWYYWDYSWLIQPFWREHSVWLPQRNVLCRQSRLKLKLLCPFCRMNFFFLLVIMCTDADFHSWEFCFTCNLIVSLSGWSSPPHWMSAWWSVSRWGWCLSWGPGVVLSRCVWCRW